MHRIYGRLCRFVAQSHIDLNVEVVEDSNSKAEVWLGE